MTVCWHRTPTDARYTGLTVVCFELEDADIALAVSGLDNHVDCLSEQAMLHLGPIVCVDPDVCIVVPRDELVVAVRRDHSAAVVDVAHPPRLEQRRQAVGRVAVANSMGQGGKEI